MKDPVLSNFTLSRSLWLLGFAGGQLSLRLLPNRFFLLRQNQLNVARVRHVGVDTSMSTVSTTPLFLGLIHLDVRDVERIHIKTLHLGIALSILKQIKDELCWLNRPASLTIGVPVLRLSGSSNTTTEATEGNSLLVSKNILQISLRLCQRQLPDSKCSLPCVLQRERENSASDNTYQCAYTLLKAISKRNQESTNRKKTMHYPCC